MTINKIRVAIDGGAATGKSSVAKNVAKKLGLNYINTGAMYRLITKFALENNIIDDEKQIVERIKEYDIKYVDGNIKTNMNIDYSNLETSEIANNVSKVSAYPLVRQYASELQMKLASEPGSLLEGRDIGTVIMKDADIKFFLTVTPEEAAKRRIGQLRKTNPDITIEEVVESIKKRNEYDSNREIAPLKKADDAISIDTSNYNMMGVVNEIVKIIETKY